MYGGSGFTGSAVVCANEADAAPLPGGARRAAGFSPGEEGEPFIYFTGRMVPSFGVSEKEMG